MGAMLAVFALGLAASLASYQFEFHNIVSDLRERTLQAQARTLAAAVHRGADRRLALDLPAQWRTDYADPSRTFTYTVYDAVTQQPIAWSANLSEPEPRPPREVSEPGGTERIALLGAGRTERAVLARRAPGGYLLVVSRGDLDRDTLIDSLFEESGEHLAVLAPVALFALGLIWIVSGWSLRPSSAHLARRPSSVLTVRTRHLSRGPPARDPAARSGGERRTRAAVAGLCR